MCSRTSSSAARGAATQLATHCRRRLPGLRHSLRPIVVADCRTPELSLAGECQALPASAEKTKEGNPCLSLGSVDQPTERTPIIKFQYNKLLCTQSTATSRASDPILGVTMPWERIKANASGT
jgi:hypothetical protein